MTGRKTSRTSGSMSATRDSRSSPVSPGMVPAVGTDGGIGYHPGVKHMGKGQQCL